MDSVVSAALNVLQRTALEIAALAGSFALCGFALHALAVAAGRLFAQFAWPRFAFVAFAWLGVPVHELSHALACWAFGHRVRRVKLFDWAGRAGSHGAVEHEFNPGNPYHRVGQLAIGLAPAIVGPIAVAALFAWLAPASPGSVLDAAVAPATWWDGAKIAARAAASPGAWARPGLWLFLYLSACVCTQIELSREDLAQARAGAVALAAVALAANVAIEALASLAGPGPFAAWNARALAWLESGARSWTSLASLSVAASAASVALIWAGMALVHAALGRPAPNPFRD